MRKFTLMVLLALFSQVLGAQVIKDSIRTQASYANDVYYSFQNGQVKTAVNSEWQLAFRIGGGMAIRSNAATASSGIGSVTVYEKPGKDTTQWATFDTLGLTTWKLLDNTDNSWENGAFNVNKDAANQYDFSWGVYNPSNHFVVGNRLYLVVIKTGSSSFVYKKLWIVNNALGTWNLKYANLDGSNEQVKQIRSSDYAGFNFAYLSMVDDLVFNHEPLAADWDFVLTRYAALQPTVPPVYYPVTGVLTNIGVKTAKVKGKNTGLVTLADTLSLASGMSEIGSDWKQLNASFQFYIPDSITYFVKTKDGAFWKLNFTGFGGSSTGNTVFTKVRVATTLATDTNKLYYGSTGGSRTVQVTSNGNWTISGPSWATFSPASGNGNATVTVGINANPLTTLRTVTATVVAGHLSKAVVLNQEASLQAITADTIRTGASYANDVYYSLNNGKVKEVTNSNWQVAFSIGATNVSVRSNTTTMSAGIGSVKIYSQSADTNNWSTFDTTGFSNWTALDNSDTLWSDGSFNMNASGGFNYGWGSYDMGTHIVTGTKLYLAAVKTSATTTVFKKIWIVSKNLGTWNIKYANLDGSNLKSTEIRSSDFAGKSYAYLSLLTDEVLDREPLASDWDFVLTRYAGLQTNVTPPVYYPVTGILTNTGVKTGEVRGRNVNLSAITDTVTMSANISEIGSDWKQLNMATFAYYAVDSLSYFVKAKDGALWKVVFTGFSSSQGTVLFTKQRVPVLTVNTSALTYIAAGENKQVAVSGNSAWTATTNQPSWITLSAASGNGNATIDITAAANVTSAARTATVTITSGTIIKMVNITQSATSDSLSVSNDTLYYVVASGSKNITITSNRSWTVSSTASWITVDATSGTGNGTLAIGVTANTGADRVADITITAGNITRTVHIIQSGVLSGLDEVKEIRIISAYPNPSNGTFTVQNKLNSEASVEVFNLNGVKVDTFMIPASQQKAVDYNTLPSGIYMLHILSNGGQQNMRLLISK